MFRRLALAIALLTISVVSVSASGPVSISVGGLQRTYLIYGQLSGAPRPVIIVLHGLGGDGASMAAATHLGDVASRMDLSPSSPMGWERFGTTIPQAAPFRRMW